MKLYLQSQLNPLLYTDAADYLINPPFQAPEGFEWREGVPGEDSEPEQSLTLGEKLWAVFGTQELSIRVQFSPVMAQIKSFLDVNDSAAAHFLLENVSVPVELQPIKENLLALLNEMAPGGA
jgi:hypothetical protein